MKALIIAAGQGNRLRESEHDRPKPLFKVVGLPLIERAILSAKRVGITEFVIVIGFKGEEIRRRLLHRQKKMGVSITFVENNDWEKSNGHSVLKARPYLENDNFILMMSDHVFDWNLLDSVIQRPPREDEVILAVDEKIDQIYDLEDATKVKVSQGFVQNIGKNLTDYNVIDTGIFYCSPVIFSALETACAEGQGSLSEAIHLLAASQKVRAFPVKGFWQDVDTPETLKVAEETLFRSVVKNTDGFISKYLNRKISGFISRFLVKTPIAPDQITWSALVIGLVSAFLVSRGTYAAVALGGIIFQFASIYDGCDGEVAKLKLCSTKFGAWLDTVCDNITYVAFLIGVISGVNHQGWRYVAPVSFLAIFGLTMTLLLMFSYLIRFAEGGSFIIIQQDLQRELESEEPSLWVRFLRKVKFMMKRDFFALTFMGLCLLNRLDVILILTALGTNITWLTLVSMKREIVPSKATEESKELGI